MKKENKKKNKIKSYKGIYIRFYNEKDIAKLNEFKRMFKVINLEKPFHLRKSFNDAMLELLLNYFDNKAIENSSTILADLIIPLLKKAFKNQLTDLIDLLIVKFNNLTQEINNLDNKFSSNANYLKLMNNFIANVTALTSNLVDDLDNKNSIYFDSPKWDK